MFSLIFYVFSIDIDNFIEGNLPGNPRDEELESILTFDEEKCDMDNLMEKGMFIKKRSFYVYVTDAIYIDLRLK